MDSCLESIMSILGLSAHRKGRRSYYIFYSLFLFSIIYILPQLLVQLKPSVPSL